MAMLGRREKEIRGGIGGVDVDVQKDVCDGRSMVELKITSAI